LHCSTSVTSTLPLHDALPIWIRFDVPRHGVAGVRRRRRLTRPSVDSRPSETILLLEHVGQVHCRQNSFTLNNIGRFARPRELLRSEEHTSELQSRENLVCRLL